MLKAAAATLALTLLPSLASANNHLVRDPSGAPMCADANGELAPLDDCAHLLPESADYYVKTDPSGARMCFANNGELAPLAMCNGKASPGRASEARRSRATTTFRPAAVRAFVLDRDPSGAPMCFGVNGALVPLSSCDARPGDVALSQR